MQFEWDEAKRLRNIEKHQSLDFLDVDLIFGGDYLEAEAKFVHGEPRWMAIGMIEHVVVTLVFTRRADIIRPISLRKASRGERARYAAVFERGSEGAPRSR
jgi:uncharacterized DUF497 family protein